MSELSIFLAAVAGVTAKTKNDDRTKGREYVAFSTRNLRKIRAIVEKFI